MESQTIRIEHGWSNCLQSKYGQDCKKNENYPVLSKYFTMAYRLAYKMPFKTIFKMKSKIHKNKLILCQIISFAYKFNNVIISTNISVLNVHYTPDLNLLFKRLYIFYIDS